MTKEEKAMAQINEILEQIDKLLKDAQKIADDNKVEFGMEVAYGMGGYYIPKRDDLSEEEARDEFGYLTERLDVDIREEGVWFPSSMSC